MLHNEPVNPSQIYAKSLAMAYNRSKEESAPTVIQELAKLFRWPKGRRAQPRLVLEFDGFIDGLTLHLAQSGFGEEIFDQVAELGIKFAPIDMPEPGPSPAGRKKSRGQRQ